MKNGFSLRQQQFQVIMYYVLQDFISSLADNTVVSRRNEQYFYFSSNLKGTQILSKLLF